MVGSPIEDEVVGKSCPWKEVLTVEVTSDNDMTTDGLSELTMRQNPNPKNSDLFYSFDIMSRENEYNIIIHLQRRCNIHIYTLVLG